MILMGQILFNFWRGGIKYGHKLKTSYNILKSPWVTSSLNIESLHPCSKAPSFMLGTSTNLEKIPSEFKDTTV